MSIQAVAWVLDHSQSRGIARLVLISLANHHNGGTGQCNPGYRRIAREAGIARGTISNAIARLVELGEIEVEEPGTSHKSARYRLLFVHQMDEATVITSISDEKCVHPGVDEASTLHGQIPKNLRHQSRTDDWKPEKIAPEAVVTETLKEARRRIASRSKGAEVA